MSSSTDHMDASSAWKTEHPYQKTDEDFKVEWEASCHCGNVKYQLSREKPLASKYCHCIQCQTMHASHQAPFQWAAIVHKTDLRFGNGAEGLTFYSNTLQKPVRELPCKAYCATCHTPIMDEGRNMIMLFPELIEGIHSEKGKEAFKVQDHICWGSRVTDNGVFEGDGVKKWSGVDGKSTLLDDGKGFKEE
ncbi:hypothetical protein VM1G_07490 [Cytospora mali]|uniref:CENP-V/GFA domain-containing protein n=1 Tax=Cytospora mali TaxID=578113 RepID=A0A194W7C9_CYTMA|nr:hypothetical protein VM1G_07490 [Valsa mali]